MNLSDVKLYLRVDGTSEDTLINDLMLAAKDYMRGAVSNYDSVADTDKAQLAERMLIADWYENRIPVGRPANAAVTLIITQLQLEGAGNE